MVDVEVKAALRESVLYVVDNLLLDAASVVTDVLAHQLPQFVLPLLLHFNLSRVELIGVHTDHRRAEMRDEPLPGFNTASHVGHGRHRLRVYELCVDVH